MAILLLWKQIYSFSVMFAGCWTWLVSARLSSPDCQLEILSRKSGQRHSQPPNPQSASKSLCSLTLGFQPVTNLGIFQEHPLTDPCFRWAIFSSLKSEPTALAWLTFSRALLSLPTHSPSISDSVYSSFVRHVYVPGSQNRVYKDLDQSPWECVDGLHDTLTFALLCVYAGQARPDYKLWVAPREKRWAWATESSYIEGLTVFVPPLSPVLINNGRGRK